MKKTLKKLFGFMVFAFAMMPMVNAEALEVNNEEALRTALEMGGEITLTEDIEVTAPLYVRKQTILKGNGNKIYASSSFTNDGANGSILTITSKNGALLQNITIEKAKKYGVQAYDGGVVVFDNTTISNSGFGAVLLNGGGAYIQSLTMNENAYGIEFGKGTNVNEEPALVMDGKITGTQNDLLVLATNDNLGAVSVLNMEGSEMKLTTDGKTLSLIDQTGKVVATSNEAKEGVVVEEEKVETTPTPTPTPTPNPDETVEENPNTGDAVFTYVALAVLGLGALGFTSKKVLSK